MGRRSDHTPGELRELIVLEGHRLISEVGFPRFSAREVAKRIGYSVGTLYNVFGDLDSMMLAINGRTLDLWRAYLVERLATAGDDRLAAAIGAYFDFAVAHRHAWTAIYDFRPADYRTMQGDYAAKVAAITGVVVDEVAAALPPHRLGDAPRLAGSLLAMVHGHCFFALNGTFGLLGEGDPLGAALSRMREAMREPDPV